MQTGPNSVNVANGGRPRRLLLFGEAEGEEPDLRIVCPTATTASPRLLYQRIIY